LPVFIESRYLALLITSRSAALLSVEGGGVTVWCITLQSMKETTLTRLIDLVTSPLKVT
jgi:hypothetical protein